MAKENILGVDIGGSKINFVLWNGREILEQRIIEKPNLTKLKEGIEKFNVKRVGVAVPGILEKKSGRVLICPNLKWLNGLNLKKLFPKKEIFLDNDVKCFLLAENVLGQVRNYQNVLAVMFGTGIGGAFTNEKLKMKNEKFKDRSICRGQDGAAGEFGHMVIDRGKTWEKLYQAAKNRPAEQAKINAIGLANLINILNPEVIILGGGGAKAPKRQLMEKYILSPLAKKTEIIFSKMGKNAAAIGAALLFGIDGVDK